MSPKYRLSLNFPQGRLPGSGANCHLLKYLQAAEMHAEAGHPRQTPDAHSERAVAALHTSAAWHHPNGAPPPGGWGGGRGGTRRQGALPADAEAVAGEAATVGSWSE